MSECEKAKTGNNELLKDRLLSSVQAERPSITDGSLAKRSALPSQFASSVRCSEEVAG